MLKRAGIWILLAGIISVFAGRAMVGWPARKEAGRLLLNCGLVVILYGTIHSATDAKVIQDSAHGPSSGSPAAKQSQRCAVCGVGLEAWWRTKEGKTLCETHARAVSGATRESTLDLFRPTPRQIKGEAEAAARSAAAEAGDDRGAIYRATISSSLGESHFSGPQSILYAKMRAYKEILASYGIQCSESHQSLD